MIKIIKINKFVTIDDIPFNLADDVRNNCDIIKFLAGMVILYFRIGVAHSFNWITSNRNMFADTSIVDDGVIRL